MKLLILARYGSLGSSSRYRIYQYIPYLQKNGWEVKVNFLLSNKYIENLYYKLPFPLFEILKNYFVRFWLLLNKRKYNAIWLQQEAFPWFPASIERLFLGSCIPIINDHDDAFFHRYDLNNSKIVRLVLGNKIDRIMSAVHQVVVGNQYLAERAKKNLAQKVDILPTVIDINRYKTKKAFNSDTFNVGWIGSPNNAKYLHIIKNVLQNICNDPQSRLILIGSGNFSIESCNFETIEWHESSEIDNILNFDVGIMPLPDNPWERGKCGFKLIQYMGCGLPVVASPVGINSHIVQHGVNGFLAESEEQWLQYLTMLKEDPKLRHKMGLNGRQMVENKYSIQVTAPVLLKYFNDLVF
jgi:glycosyltransferase involved in cell wall biosynthesis